ncbi:hypothetical protein GW796_08080 [archaeon]|nr:hypothetical protein [archaeon]
MSSFENHCNDFGYKIRPHSSLTQIGIQVLKDGHWMGVVWNKNFKRYTVDIRMKELVDSFLNFENTTVEVKNDKKKKI